MDKAELRIERNSIYAKYGREFKSEDLKNYFNSKSWYKINQEYSDSLISNEDRNTINLIKCWENSNEILWETKADLNGDTKLESCYLLKSSIIGEAMFIINESFFNLNLNWYYNFDDKFIVKSTRDDLMDHYEYEDLYIEIINLNNDLRKEILFTQYFPEYEDPDPENIFISYIDSKIITSKIDGYIGYKNDSIIHNYLDYIEIIKDTILNEDSVELYYKVYNCSDNYILENGILELKKNNCAFYDIWDVIPACFTSNSKISTNNNEYKLIKDLKVGDSVLTCDLKLKKQYVTTISNLASVKHSNLVELYFKHDTITSTTDHPYYVYNKGWCSFKPNSTLMNYSNYNKVNKISNGDYFILNNGDKSQLIGYSYINQEMQTYTITKLENGNTFYVNGVLVGVEEINKHTTNNVYSSLKRTIH